MADVRAGAQQVGRDAVPEGVAGDVLLHPRLACPGAHDLARISPRESPALPAGRRADSATSRRVDIAGDEEPWASYALIASAEAAARVSGTFRPFPPLPITIRSTRSSVSTSSGRRHTSSLARIPVA